jgi:transposase
MDCLIARCAGLDLHKATVVACVRVPGAARTRETSLQTFGTTTADLLALRDWLEAWQITDVAMESTGVYWKPVYYLLEDRFTCCLVNAAHLAHVPGRKTDVRDAQWIAQCLECGLLRASFVPPPPMRDLRDLTRYRKAVIEDRTRDANRLHKVLLDAGIQLSSVATDILGVSGRAMLEALVTGTTDPTVLADLARGSLRRKLPALRAALTGRFRPHHAHLVSHLLAHLEYLDDLIDALSTEIATQLAPFATSLAHLRTIPGVDQRTAEVLLAELGLDMTVFPTAGHAASWAGLCPGQHQSGGKHYPARTRHGNRWLRKTLLQAALGVTRKRDSALAARYYRIRAHRGHKKAAVAVAHALVVTAYYILARNCDYRELGADYFERHLTERTQRRAVQALERLGYHVTLQKVA